MKKMIKKTVQVGILIFVLAVEFCSIGQAAPRRIAFVGDSITCGIGTSSPEWKSYPALLQRMLGPDWVVGNFGCSGANVTEQGGLPYVKQERFQYAKDFRPDTVVIMLGTNDTTPKNWLHREEFAEDYTRLIHQFEDIDSKPRILVCLPPYIAGTAADGQTNQNLEEVISLIREVAQREKLSAINVHGVTSGKAELLSDGLHPNDAGAATIAQTIYGALTGKTWQGEIPNELVSEWNGGKRRDFFVNGRFGTLVVPSEPREGRPWIWRTEFFDAYPSVDAALLRDGYHVAYLNVQNLYGAPSAIEAMKEFYDFLVSKEKLSPRPILEGFSRGGLFALNWATKYPEQTGALYLDAPVCDFKSWPGGKGKGEGSPADWEQCKKVYGLSEQAALQFPGNPVDNLKPIAEAKIPIIAVAGDADTVVPMSENIRVVEERYRALDGQIETIVKPGVDHHPHSLEDPTPIVKFLEKNALR